MSRIEDEINDRINHIICVEVEKRCKAILEDNKSLKERADNRQSELRKEIMRLNKTIYRLEDELDEIKQYRILWHTYEERIEIDKKVMREFYIPKEQDE